MIIQFVNHFTAGPMPTNRKLPPRENKWGGWEGECAEEEKEESKTEGKGRKKTGRFAKVE